MKGEKEKKYKSQRSDDNNPHPGVPSTFLETTVLPNPPRPRPTHTQPPRKHVGGAAERRGVLAAG